MPVKLFFCYAHEDEAFLNKLKTHLGPLRRQGLIDVWHDRDIGAGIEWEQEISEHLSTAQIILLLVSPDFMDSEYCYGIELKRAIERHKRGEARVIPVILRPVYWQGVLGMLQALPQDALPITDPGWQNVDRALYNVTQGIFKVVDELTPKQPPVDPPPPQQQPPIGTPPQGQLQLDDFDTITAGAKRGAGLVYLAALLALLLTGDIRQELFLLSFPVFSIIVLIVQHRTKKPSRFVRFHAMQSILLGSVSLLGGIALVIIYVFAIFAVFPNGEIGFSLAIFSFLIAILLFALPIIVLIIAMVGAFLGRSTRLPLLEKYAEKYADRRLAVGKQVV
jgi:uncharacterized membrane protein